MIGAACESYDEALMADILRSIPEEGGIIIDASGFAWSGLRDPARTMLQVTDVPSQAAGPRLPVASFQDLHASTGASSSHVPHSPEENPPCRGNTGDREVDLEPSSPYVATRTPGARSSHEPPYPENGHSDGESPASRPPSLGPDPTNTESSNDDSPTPEELDEHDGHVAEAAFVLWLEGLNFDWTQLTPNQQDHYHTMVGRYLQNLKDVD